MGILDRFRRDPDDEYKEDSEKESCYACERPYGVVLGKGLAALIVLSLVLTGGGTWALATSGVSVVSYADIQGVSYAVSDTAVIKSNEWEPVDGSWDYKVTITNTAGDVATFEVTLVLDGVEHGPLSIGPLANGADGSATFDVSVSDLDGRVCVIQVAEA